MSAITSNFTSSEMHAAAAEYFNALLDEGRSPDRLSAVMTADHVFITNLPNTKEKVEATRERTLKLFTDGHFENIVGPVKKRSESYRESRSEPNKMVCRISNIQTRLGKGMGEQSEEKDYKISAKLELFFAKEDGELKISKAVEHRYKKLPVESEKTSLDRSCGSEKV